MPREPRAYLWEASRAADLIATFVSDRTDADFKTDVMLQSAVERQFEIVGEALNQLSRSRPEIAVQIPDLARIVAFRNILIHGYASVDVELVWEVASKRLGPLADLLDQLLADPGTAV